MNDSAALSQSGPIILFDGVCNLCDRSVQFILDRDPAGVFRFASLQSDTGRALLVDHQLDPDALASIVVVDGDRAFTHSDAALRIARDLRAPWNALATLRIAPRPLRDWVYGIVAKNRYRWFGTREACRIPTPDVAARFLDV
ncbi:MAG: thiol-disulfide oxidoreductase DCC family protein [Rubricoccaceae bacterium]